MQHSALSDKPAAAPSGLPALVARFGRFVLVGGTVTLIYAVLSLLFHAKFGLPPVSASFAANIIAAVFSYLGHRLYTFYSNRPHREAVASFAVLTLVGFGFSIFTPWVLTSTFGLPMIIPVAVTSIAVPMFNFLVMGKLVFPR